VNVSFTIANLVGVPRASGRIAPTHNFVDDLTWNKGRHTVQTGINFRLITNDRMNMNNYPTYSYSRNTLKGLGNDITDAVNAAARAKYGNSALRLTEAVQVTNAMGTLLGVVNNYSFTYQFGRTASPPLRAAPSSAASARKSTSSMSRTHSRCAATSP
jgi:hypothetical protein